MRPLQVPGISDRADVMRGSIRHHYSLYLSDISHLHCLTLSYHHWTLDINFPLNMASKIDANQRINK